MLKAVEWKQNKLTLLDQTQLPAKQARIGCRTPQQLAAALTQAKLASGTAAGVAAALSVALGLKLPPLARDFEQLKSQTDRVCALLGKTRPHSMHLQWALERMKRCIRGHRDYKMNALREIALKEALAIQREDERAVKTIAGLGAGLLREGDSILISGGSGILSAGGAGPVTAVIAEALQAHPGLQVWLAETRPDLEGARVAALALKMARIPFHLITDNAVATWMKQGRIQVAMAGAMQVAMNGDIISEVGTYALAMLAYHHHLPFYVSVPVSAFDRQLHSGEAVPMDEHRNEAVIKLAGKNLTAQGVKALHPGQDVIPHKFVSALVTDLGVIRAPYDQNLRNLFATLN